MTAGARPAALVDLFDWATAQGARPEWVSRVPEGPCGWCSLEGREATVTVTGDPDPSLPYEGELEQVVVCPVCARHAVRQAVVEHAPHSRRPVVVEIADGAG